MNQRDLIRLCLMLVVLGFNSLFSFYAAPGFQASFQTVGALRLGSYAVLIMTAVLFLQAALCGRQHAPHHPRLSLLTLVTHVYGLGLALFVTVYSLTGASSDTTTMYFVALSVIACDDLLERAKDSNIRRALICFSVVFSATALVCAGFLDPKIGETAEAAMQGKWLVPAFGAAAPLVSPFIVLAVRGKRFYNPVTVYDFIYFAIPFACFLSCQALLFLGMLPPEQDWEPSAVNASLPPGADLNQTLLYYERLVSASDVYVPLLAFNMVPTVFLAVQSTLLYSTADFLATAAVVWAFRSLALHEASPLAVVVFVSASVAYTVRIYACFREDGDASSVAYTKETEDGEDEDRMLKALQIEAMQDESL